MTDELRQAIMPIPEANEELIKFEKKQIQLGVFVRRVAKLIGWDEEKVHHHAVNTVNIKEQDKKTE
jgi:hypothetical protein